MTETCRIAELNSRTAEQIAEWVKESRDETSIVDAQVILAAKTRREVLDAIRPFAEVMGPETAAHLLFACALAAARKEGVDHGDAA